MLPGPVLVHKGDSRRSADGGFDNQRRLLSPFLCFSVSSFIRSLVAARHPILSAVAVRQGKERGGKNSP